MSAKLYVFWLPIIDFSEFCEKLNLQDLKLKSNSNWSWITFIQDNISFTIDSLGFVYLDGVTNEEHLDKALVFLANNLNKKSRVNIENTFLNTNIGYVEEANALFGFMKSLATPFSPIVDNLLFEEISSSLLVKENVLSEEKALKFSLNSDNDGFHTILNRNFEKMLNKSIYFTHGLNLEEGELYELSILENVYETIADKLPTLKLKVNGVCQAKEREGLFKQVIQKVIQDTIEERVILNFLKITKRGYLNQIIDEISINNDILKKLNSYLLEDIKHESDKYKKMKDLDDESATEIFIQNLLQVIPKFYMMDTKLQEAYYIKIGNSTTNLNVKKEETILNTLYYRKWKASINFFIETASKAKESLGMYHQNKTLKELEDISYNANYQADIEDIRELQKNKALLLDGETKKVLFLVAIITLTGEVPIVEFPNANAMLLNIVAHIAGILINFIIYSSLLYAVIIPFVRGKENETSFVEVAKSFGRYLKERIVSLFTREKRETSPMSTLHSHTFEESDYDKHELRSTRSLYSYNEQLKSYEKIFINYNNLVSAYTLVEKLKKVRLRQKTAMGQFGFELFPKLLRDVPIDDEEKHIYRENYRISGNDRVATKIMYRYKLSELTLNSLLDEMQEDSFMSHYAKYLTQEEGESFSIEEAIKHLRPTNESQEESQVTLYIVYSFVLKFHSIDENNKNIFNYTISKDQFRVHYHISILEYLDQEDFEKKQANLAKLIDVYFLKRLKRFKEVELV